MARREGKRPFYWTDEEIQLLETYAATVRDKVLARLFPNRSLSAVVSKRVLIGIYKHKARKLPKTKRWLWSEEEKETLRLLGPLYSAKILARYFFPGRTPKTVDSMRWKLAGKTQGKTIRRTTFDNYEAAKAAGWRDSEWQK